MAAFCAFKYQIKSVSDTGKWVETFFKKTSPREELSIYASHESKHHYLQYNSKATALSKEEFSVSHRWMTALRPFTHTSKSGHKMAVITQKLWYDRLALGEWFQRLGKTAFYNCSKASLYGLINMWGYGWQGKAFRFIDTQERKPGGAER